MQAADYGGAQVVAVLDKGRLDGKARRLVDDDYRVVFVQNARVVQFKFYVVGGLFVKEFFLVNKNFDPRVFFKGERGIFASEKAAAARVLGLLAVITALDAGIFLPRLWADKNVSAKEQAANL